MTPARTLVPRAPQLPIIDHILAHKRCAVHAGMGIGKTSATLLALDALLFTEGGPVLVLAPLRVAQSTWPDEVAKWANFRHLRIVAIVGTEEQRRAAAATPADVYTINYDNIEWLCEGLAGRWPYRIVVADESTRLKSFRTKQGGARARALSEYATRAERWIELTGTPVPNGLKDLWGQMWFVDFGRRLGRSFAAFERRWFRRGRDGFSIQPLDSAMPEITKRVRDLCVSINPKDYFDLSDPIVSTVRVKLPAKARTHYREMSRKLYTEIEGKPIEAFEAAAKSMKLAQIASGAAYVDGGTSDWVEVHTEKIEALRSIVEEASGAPVLVAYHFRSDLARLLKAFPRGRVLDKKASTITAWNEGKIPLLFLHPASAGHGLNLQDGGNILVYFSQSFDFEVIDQVLERIGPLRQMQSGHDRPVFVYRIVAEGTIDEDMIAALEGKRDVQNALLAGLKKWIN